MASPILLYTYQSCDACRKAVKWLAARSVQVVEKPIRATPPSVAELRAMLAHLGGERRRLCNTAGADYRAAKLGERLDALPEAEFLALLAANGNLVKRPFLLRAAPPLGLVGFDPERWAEAFPG